MKKEKKILHLCRLCDREFIDYESKDRKFCSRECYHKSLKAHGKWLFLKYGKIALIRLDNLRVEARNLGKRIRYWWKTTKQELEEFIRRCKKVIERKFEYARMYNIAPKYAKTNFDDIPPPNMIPID